jgi:hypothetical protein
MELHTSRSEKQFEFPLYIGSAALILNHCRQSMLQIGKPASWDTWCIWPNAFDLSPSLTYLPLWPTLFGQDQCPNVGIAQEYLNAKLPEVCIMESVGRTVYLSISAQFIFVSQIHSYIHTYSTSLGLCEGLLPCEGRTCVQFAVFTFTWAHYLFI